MERRFVEFKNQNQRFAVSVPMIDELYLPILSTIYAHWAALNKIKTFSVQGMPVELSALLYRFLQVNGMHPETRGMPMVKPRPKSRVQLEDRRHAVFLTGGKDSTHLTKWLVEVHGAANVKAFYVANLNDTESPFEQWAVVKLAQHFGIDHEIIGVENCLRGYRDGEPIGLRDQLIYMLSLPLLLEWGAGHVWFGTSRFAHSTNSFTETHQAHAFTQNLVRDIFDTHPQIHLYADHFEKLKIRPKSVAAEVTIKDLIQKNRELLDLTASCSTPIDLRKEKNFRMNLKFQGQTLYRGCGHCVKCGRINGGILAFGNEEDNILDFARWWVGHYREASNKDETLYTLLSYISDHYRLAQTKPSRS